MTFQVYITSSELWSVNLGYHFWAEVKNSWVYSRVLFYLPLQLVQSFTEDPVVNLYIVRALMLVWTGVLIFSIARFLKKLHSDSKEKFLWSLVLVLGLLFSNNTFLNQGFRIRSDFFSTVFALWSLTYFIFSDKKTAAKDLLFFVLPLFATPKAAIYLLGFLIFKPWQRITARRGGWIYLSAFILGLSFLFFVLYQDSLLFLSAALFKHTGSPDYFSQLSYYHVYKSLKLNLFFYFLLARVTYLSWQRLFDQEFKTLSSWQRYEIFCVFLLASLLVLPEKVPFLIASLLPFWAIMMHSYLLQWFQELNLRKWMVSFSLLIVLLGFSTRWVIENLTENFNTFQLEVISQLNIYLQKNNITYFDAIGIVPAKDVYRVFAGPNSAASEDMAHRIVREAAPDMLLITEGLVPMETVENDTLNSKYINVANGIFARASNFRSMTQSEILNFISENQKKLPPEQTVLVEIMVLNGYKIEQIERINLTLAELLRKYNDIIKTKRSGKGSVVQIGRVSLLPELKVSLRDSLPNLFKFDVRF